jgi:hypothetical protein
MDKIGRNDPCPCGSGKKYKKCCLEKDEQEKSEQRKLKAQEEAAETTDEEKEKEDRTALPGRKQKRPQQPGFRGYEPPKKGTGFVERGRKSANRTGE